MLSIVIPMYNCELFIKDCLESIIAVKNKLIENVEVILVDDGSTDNTLKICSSFVSDHKEVSIKIISIKNHGVSYARNLGIKNSSGKYIMFLDSDDRLSLKYLDIVFEKINSNDDVIFFSKLLDENISKEQLILKLSGCKSNSIGISGPFSKIFNRKFLEKNKIKFDVDLINGEDMIFCIESLIKAKKFSVLSKSFYEYRIHIGSATQRFDEKIIESDRKFHEKLHYILEKNNLDENLQSEIYTYSLCNAIFLLSSRISYIKNPFLVMKKYNLFLNTFPYNEINIQKVNLDKKRKMIVILNKMNLILVSDFILKLYHFKKAQSKKQKNYFVTI